jgi:hypothetical protein
MTYVYQTIFYIDISDYMSKSLYTSEVGIQTYVIKIKAKRQKKVSLVKLVMIKNVLNISM